MGTLHKSNSNTEYQALLAQLAAAKEENDALKAKAKSLFRLKVSEKGALSAYGLGQRFPVTLYPDQWIMVLDHDKDIRAAIKAHASEFKTRD